MQTPDRASQPIELKDCRVLVMGLGQSGCAAAEFLIAQGAVVSATDQSPPDLLLEATRRLEPLGVKLAMGQHPHELFEAAELIVISPGVPHTLASLAAARARGIPVIGELELAARFTKEPMVAVSGTNGKTTTTTLIGQMLQASGQRVFVGGNIGVPLIAHVASGRRADVLVLEVSSFQLDTIVHFRPDVAVLLNIAEDHLDRYRDMNAYAASKARLFKNQHKDDVAVLNIQDARTQQLMPMIKGRRLFFGPGPGAANGAVITDHQLLLRLPERPELAIDLTPSSLRGQHNRENMAAAALAALSAGATAEGVQNALSDFKGLAHRLESIGAVQGVTFIDDSKATNVDAVARALEAFEAPVVLIMGGRDKGSPFQLLRDTVRRRVKALVLLGEAQETIHTALQGTAPMHRVDSMGEAVQRAYAAASSGEVVLLAPACASFDMYSNYAERGTAFCRAVEQLRP